MYDKTVVSLDLREDVCVLGHGQCAYQRLIVLSPVHSMMP